jgi:hypothetical protein
MDVYALFVQDLGRYRLEHEREGVALTGIVQLNVCCHPSFTLSISAPYELQKDSMKYRSSLYIHAIQRKFGCDERGALTSIPTGEQSCRA